MHVTLILRYYMQGTVVSCTFDYHRSHRSSHQWNQGVWNRNFESSGSWGHFLLYNLRARNCSSRKPMMLSRYPYGPSNVASRLSSVTPLGLDRKSPLQPWKKWQVRKCRFHEHATQRRMSLGPWESQASSSPVAWLSCFTAFFQKKLLMRIAIIRICHGLESCSSFPQSYHGDNCKGPPPFPRATKSPNFFGN